MKNNNYRRWLQLSAANLLLCAAPLASSATIFSVGFATAGAGSWGGSCGVSCTQLNINGTTTLTGLESYFSPSATPAFDFSAQVDLTQFGLLGGAAIGVAPSGGWSLQDGFGDSLYGSVWGWFSGTNASSNRTAGLLYGITGGTGVFNGVSGVAGSSADLAPQTDDYSESGDFLLVSSSSPVGVPEPGPLSLLATAVVALAWSVWRRRAQKNPA